MYLKFVGNKDGYFAGLPNADFNGDDPHELEIRLATNWWVEVKEEVKKPEPTTISKKKFTEKEEEKPVAQVEEIKEN